MMRHRLVAFDALHLFHRSAKSVGVLWSNTRLMGFFVMNRGHCGSGLCRVFGVTVPVSEVYLFEVVCTFTQVQVAVLAHHAEMRLFAFFDFLRLSVNLFAAFLFTLTMLFFPCPVNFLTTLFSLFAGSFLIDVRFLPLIGV